MTETTPKYGARLTAVPQGRLPRRAWNLAMRMLTLEQEVNGRGRATVEVIFIDGEWLISISRPGALEHLGDG